MKKLFGYELSNVTVSYLEAFVQEEKSYEHVLRKVPVAVVGIMMCLYAVLIVSVWYINRDHYKEAYRLQKYFRSHKGQAEYKAKEEKLARYTVEPYIIRKGYEEVASIIFDRPIESRK